MSKPLASTSHILHEHTKRQVAQFISKPSHALLLVGPNGSGKTYLAKIIVAAVLQLEPTRLEQHPYYKFLTSGKDKNSISIDAIRQLQHFLQLKTIGSQTIRRAVVVEHAQQLTDEAQNAYLKLLEEPPGDTITVLTADSQRALLPTIMSRVQAIAVHTPTEDMLKEFFTLKGRGEAAIGQAYFLSGGLPGLMHALLDNDVQHPLRAGVDQAKDILQKQMFERLALVEDLSKRKEVAAYVLEALQHIARTGIDQATKRCDSAKLGRWYHVLKVASEARQALAGNANTKLTLSNLMLHI